MTVTALDSSRISFPYKWLKVWDFLFVGISASFPVPFPSFPVAVGPLTIGNYSCVFFPLEGIPGANVSSPDRQVGSKERMWYAFAHTVPPVITYVILKLWASAIFYRRVVYSVPGRSTGQAVIPGFPKS